MRRPKEPSGTFSFPAEACRSAYLQCCLVTTDPTPAAGAAPGRPNWSFPSLRLCTKDRSRPSSLRFPSSPGHLQLRLTLRESKSPDRQKEITKSVCERRGAARRNPITLQPPFAPRHPRLYTFLYYLPSSFRQAPKFKTSAPLPHLWRWGKILSYCAGISGIYWRWWE